MIFAILGFLAAVVIVAIVSHRELRDRRAAKHIVDENLLGVAPKCAAASPAMQANEVFPSAHVMPTRAEMNAAQAELEAQQRTACHDSRCKGRGRLGHNCHDFDCKQHYPRR